jgi:urease accessory protein
LLTGLSHPVSGADHVAAMFAVGLWGAQLRRPALWVLPVMFPMVMACGAFLALVGLGLPWVETGIALSAVVLGAAIVAEARPPLAVSILIVSVFAVFHGHAHGTELPADQDGLAYSVGFVVSTGLLHACGIGIGAIHRWGRGARAIRVIGAGILLAGLVFLWRSVT